ncbi:NAD(P)/FAD-dependent oxidoreductase [Aliifodinibius sp. S!AR15-10]|uniref:phytoene desaturase family protein n=1 Tax=Aliifodinibius sp. S!AR15-10 TaxID=2950437 RepID=UPI00285D3714|nr:NAD(P)/FAD-dependent oxidoreductase [Aliifodinibius sp. S!AR15-10]MDR8394012.1 NAD(P)/FAD-dependent oxidoreductase [Aliifodinibius sp. S!AR15-10]
MTTSKYDAIVVGSGPNGLAAAVALAQQGLHVKVIEAKEIIGGGTRTQELTLPGFHHDVCSAIHPMAVASPYFKTLPLDEHGLEWIYPEYPLAHPLDDEPAVVMQTSLDNTAEELEIDAAAYRKLFEPIVFNFDQLAPQLLAPFSPFPSTPLLMARFGWNALKSARSLAFAKFKSHRTRALFGGLAAHSILPMEKRISAAIALVLGAVGHRLGWPIPRGGSHQITKALASYFESLGGDIETGVKVESLDQLESARTVFFDLTPQQVLEITGSSIPNSYAKKLRRYRYGAGVFKLDLALEGPIPWQDKRCQKAGTVHLGGTFEEISASEYAMANGRHIDKPYVLVAQQSLFDDTRAPGDKHTAWAYCHVPNGSTHDMTRAIENQIERFAPGFRDLIIEHHTMNTEQMHNYNANYIGGDINGGLQDITQLFTRPAGVFNPYHIPQTSYYICSSSTPPGGGVHGMCGYHAAQAALNREFS